MDHHTESDQPLRDQAIKIAHAWNQVGRRPDIPLVDRFRDELQELESQQPSPHRQSHLPHGIIGQSLSTLGTDPPDASTIIAHSALQATLSGIEIIPRLQDHPDIQEELIEYGLEIGSRKINSIIDGTRSSRGNIATLVHNSVTNKARTLMKYQTQLVELTDESLSPTDTSRPVEIQALDQVFQSQSATILEAAMDALPIHRKDIITLRIFKGATIEETAQILGISGKRVTDLTHDALWRLGKNPQIMNLKP